MSAPAIKSGPAPSYLITNRKVTPQGFGNDRNSDGLTCWSCLTDPSLFSNWASITATALKAALTKPPLLFVHGFNNTFVKADDMAAQIQKSVPEREAITFDWVSLGHWDVASYEVDRIRARESGPDLYKAIQMFDDVDVICHSMGNYVLQNAIPGKGKVKLAIEHLALIAADVSNTVLSSLEGSARRGLVAYCKEDGALAPSTILHFMTADGLPRLGLTGPFGSIPPNFSVVDCTKLLADQKNPIAKHSAYFFHDAFYGVLNGFLAS